MGLMTETNTPAMEKRVLRAARSFFGFPRNSQRVTAHFEHGQWWITRPRTGAQWSANDASGPGSFYGFCFEQVTNGDDE